MRTVFVGAGEFTVYAARSLVKKGHEVVIIETDKEKIDSLSDELDCSFLCGDGSRPDILGEVNPKKTDFLFCLSDNDQANLIASLMGRSLGFKRVVTSISDEQFEGICRELGLEDIIIPSRTIGRYLEDMVNGGQNIELSTVLKDDARLFTFTAGDEHAVKVADLDLPEQARVICRYRDGKFALVDEETKIEEGDEIVILTHGKHLETLEERWQPRRSSDENETTRGGAKEDETQEEKS